MGVPVVEASGTKTCTGSGTEDTLATVNLARTLSLIIDTTNMTAASVLTIRAKRKVLSGSAVVTVHEETINGVQDQPGWIMVPMPSPHQAVFTITQQDATPISVPWSVESQ